MKKFLIILSALFCIFAIIFLVAFVADLRSSSINVDKYYSTHKNMIKDDGVSIIKTTKSNANDYNGYQRNESSSTPQIPVISKFIGIERLYASTLDDTEFFFDGNNWYAFHYEISKDCHFGETLCNLETFYGIGLDNKATVLARNTRGLGIIDSKAGVPLYRTSSNMYGHGYKYYKDQRGNFFVSLNGYIYLIKNGGLAAKIDKKLNTGRERMFSDKSNTYVDYAIQDVETLEVTHDVYRLEL